MNPGPHHVLRSLALAACGLALGCGVDLECESVGAYEKDGLCVFRDAEVEGGGGDGGGRDAASKDAAREDSGDDAKAPEPRAKGEVCTDANDCKSGHCADGVCCNAACDGTCDRCDTGEVGKCELDDGLCGTCGACREDASCDMRASACTGDCSVCQAAGDRFQCTPDQSQCVGDCNACQGSGTAFSCGDADGLCALCQKCSSGLCVNQSAAEDLKDDCPESDCGSGLCNGSGACTVEPEGTSCETGICRRCDGAGSCVPTETHEDCGTCEMCGEEGECVAQPYLEDLKDDCDPIDCGAFVAGWSTEDPRICTHFGKTGKVNGLCDHGGICGSLDRSCARSLGGPACGSLECRKAYGSPITQACRVGQLVSLSDETTEICFTSGQRLCPDGQVCDATGTCVPD